MSIGKRDRSTRTPTKLQQSEHRLREAQRLASIGSWELDVRTGVLTWSDEHFRLFGLTPPPDGVVDYATLERLPRDAAFARDVMERALRTQRHFSYSYRVRLRGGKMRHMHAIGESLLDTAGRPRKLVGTTQDVTERRRAEEEREEMHQQVLASRTQLQQLTRRLFQTQEDERRRLAGELHDEIGQVLTAVSLSLEIALANTGEAARQSLTQSAAAVDHAIEQVRGMSLDLRPAMLDVLGLEPTLRWLADRQKGIAVDLCSELDGQRAAPELESACYRIVQEALTNVARHAQANGVRIELARKRTRLTLSIQDDGVGFDVAAARARATAGGSFGLLGIEERVRLLGGKCDIVSTAGQGTSIRVCLPWTRS